MIGVIGVIRVNYIIVFRKRIKIKTAMSL